MSNYFETNKYSNYVGINNNSLSRNFFNINKSFEENNHLIDKTEFKNKGKIIHNNISDNIFSEGIVEYQINIDSNDRKINVYPNPFKFTISFGGLGPQQFTNKISNKKNYDNDNNNYFEGTPGPIIERNFKNVKYIKLDFLMLPRIFKINLKNDEIEFSDSHHCTISSYGYLILRINEISSSKILGTNSLLTKDTFILYPDKLMGNDFVMWVTSNGSRIYNNSNLGNLDKLSITIMTPSGKQLSFLDNNDKEIKFDMLYKRRYKNRNMSLNFIENKLKCYISILVGAYENEINTNINY